MRIAVWHNLPSGGAKRALYDAVAGLLKLGHHVEAWAPPSIDRSYLPLETMIREHIVPYGDDSYRLSDKLQLTLHIDRRIAAMEEHCRRCAEEIAGGSFDILFGNSCTYYRSAPIARYVDLPSVLYLQEPYRWLYEAMPDQIWAAPPPGEGFPTLGRLKSAFLDLRKVRNARVQMREEIRSAKSFGRILCNSYFSRESILRAYGVEAEVCYMGVDESHFQVGPSGREPIVVGLGSVTPEKNPRLCIEAVARMKEPRPTLVWIGNFAIAGHLEEIKAVAGELGVNLEVKVDIPEEELLRDLQRATAMIYAPRLEPFGLAPIEAGACGTPVVGIPEAGVRETVVDGVNGLVADAEPSALAAALDRIFADPELASRLGAEGRRRAETIWSQRAATDRLAAKLQAEIERRRAA